MDGIGFDPTVVPISTLRFSSEIPSVKRRARDDIGRRQSTNKICSKDKTRIGFFDTRKNTKKGNVREGTSGKGSMYRQKHRC